VVAAGAFGILAAAIGVVAYKTWKMAEIHRGVMEELEKKEKYSFPSIDAMYASLNRTYNEAKRVKSVVDELTADKLVIDETGQPMGVFSRRGWQAFGNALAMSNGAYGLEPYTYSDAYQDNIKEGLTTLARQQAVDIRSSFFGELEKQRTPLEAAAFIGTIDDFYKLDLNTVDTSLYTSGTYRNGPNKGQQWNSYNAQTGEGQYLTGLKKTLTIAQGMRTGTYINWINTNLVPELTSFAKEYQNIISSQSYAEQALSKVQIENGQIIPGLNFAELKSLGLQKDANTGQWTIPQLPSTASDDEKKQHLINSRLIHNDLVAYTGILRKHWGGNGSIAESIMMAAGFSPELFSNEPDRNDMAPWNKPGISSEDGDDGGAGGNYSGTGKLSSAAPKQVIVNITNLLSVETIELLKTTDGKHPEIQDLKEQMAEALISVVHDFDASWNA